MVSIAMARIGLFASQPSDARCLTSGSTQHCAPGGFGGNQHRYRSRGTTRVSLVVRLVEESMTVTLNLLVLRCRDMEASKVFYSELGVEFRSERHGAGPQHYAAELGSFVLELYPLRKSDNLDNSRLGFSYGCLADVSANVRAANIPIVDPVQSLNGRLVLVVQDPDGRKIELSQPLH